MLLTRLKEPLLGALAGYLGALLLRHGRGPQVDELRQREDGAVANLATVESANSLRITNGWVANKDTRAREKRRKSKRTNNANYERLVPSSIQARVIGKTVPLCGAAQHTGVWGVPRPDVDRVCDRE